MLFTFSWCFLGTEEPRVLLSLTALCRHTALVSLYWPKFKESDQVSKKIFSSLCPTNIPKNLLVSVVTFQNRSWVVQYSSYLSRKNLQGLQFSTSAQVLYFGMVLKTERMGNSLTIKSTSIRTSDKARPSLCSLQNLSWTRQLLFARTRINLFTEFSSRSNRSLS